MVEYVDVVSAHGILNRNHEIFSSLQALCFYNLAGASIDPGTLKHVAKVCAGVELSDHVVQVSI